MKLNSLISYVWMMLLGLSSCIKSYYPDLDNADYTKFVVTGQVNKGDTIQYVNVFTTTVISKYITKNPVIGCAVYIIDNKGNTYDATELQDGTYACRIPESQLVNGASFRVDIYIPTEDFTHPEPIHLVSDFDEISDCPDIDSVYFKKEKYPDLNPLLALDGLRFYLDLDARNVDSRFFRWDAVETWEYHAELASSSTPLERVCWMKNQIKDVYIFSTKLLTENTYGHFPLHFVDNISSQRLAYGYSLLIRQYSLSEKAYNYWEKIRFNSSSQGGLYEKQPVGIKGNMYNLTNPGQQVFGFFGASSVKSKRIFVRNAIPYIGVECVPEPGAKPPPQCYHCQLSGGTNIKPSFWPY